VYQPSHSTANSYDGRGVGFWCVWQATRWLTSTMAGAAPVTHLNVLWTLSLQNVQHINSSWWQMWPLLYDVADNISMLNFTSKTARVNRASLASAVSDCHIAAADTGVTASTRGLHMAVESPSVASLSGAADNCQVATEHSASAQRSH